MCPSEDLKRVFGAVADVERPPADPAADLARARVAARARGRRRFRLALTGMTTVAVLVLGASLLRDSPAPTPTPVASGVELVAEPFEATPYTFDLTPRGWSVQGQRPAAVTIAPDDGSTSSHPDDFVGKLVILFDANPVGGRRIVHEGREFWISGSADYTLLSTLTRPGEPRGVVRIQYPADAGWNRDSMLAFLGSVHVGPGARHGFG